MSASADSIEWFRYPFVAAHDLAKAWLTTETLLGLAPNTLDAYARGLDDFLGFCERADISPMTATRADLARYVGDLRGRPRPASHRGLSDLVPLTGLSNATLQQRLTAVRLFFDFLIEEGQRADHPVGRGRYTPGKAFGADRERALVPRFQTMPWIPSDEQWRAFLAVVKQAPLRTRCMAALAYDAGLRREEVCSVRSDDLDPARRMVGVCKLSRLCARKAVNNVKDESGAALVEFPYSMSAHRIPWRCSGIKGRFAFSLDARASPWCEKSTPLMKQKNSSFTLESLMPLELFSTFCTSLR